MEVSYNTDQVNSLFAEAQEIALLTRENPNVDQVAGLLGFAGVLEDEGKKVIPVFSGTIPSEIKFLKKSAEIKHSLGVNDLQISFDLKNSPIEKVSYYLEDHTFNLLIRPEKKDFSIENVRYSYRGPKYDLIVVLDCKNLSDLAELYTENQELFENTPILNISTNSNTEEFADVNIVDCSVSGLSELFFHALPQWKLRPSPEDAEAFLAGIASLKEQ